jgi:hypothetical protein
MGLQLNFTSWNLCMHACMKKWGMQICITSRWHHQEAKSEGSAKILLLKGDTRSSVMASGDNRKAMSEPSLATPAHTSSECTCDGDCSICLVSPCNDCSDVDRLRAALQKKIPHILLGEVLGTGGISVCFAAEDLRRGEALAVKVSHRGVPHNSKDFVTEMAMVSGGAEYDLQTKNMQSCIWVADLR